MLDDPISAHDAVAAPVRDGLANTAVKGRIALPKEGSWSKRVAGGWERGGSSVAPYR
jgi:hypothetical protein